jgi:hypothetical protein
MCSVSRPCRARPVRGPVTQISPHVEVADGCHLLLCGILLCACSEPVRCTMPKLYIAFDDKQAHHTGTPWAASPWKAATVWQI